MLKKDQEFSSRMAARQDKNQVEYLEYPIITVWSSMIGNVLQEQATVK